MAHDDLRLDILPDAQRRVWPELAEIPDQFTLYGGTAIALQIGHRESIDFDFFAAAPIDPQSLLREMPLLDGAEILQLAPDTLSVRIDRYGPVLLSFFGLGWLRTANAPLVAADNGLKLASLLDLGATKMATVQARAEAKDYLDIDALIGHGLTLQSQLDAARLVHGSRFDPLPTMKALTFFDDGNLSTVPQDVRRRLIDAINLIAP